MVTIDVLTHFFQANAEEVLDHFKVFWGFDDFQYFLNRPGTMSVFAEL
jgi:hypothetical protein